MSRAAKKRAKKKQKSLDTNSSTKRPASPEIENSASELHHGEKGFRNKKIKSIVEKEEPYLGGEFQDDGDACEHLSAHRSSSPSVQFPTLPSNTPIVDILLLKDASSKLKLAKQLECLTAKQRAACLFQAILAPTTLEEFYNEYWEKKPLLVRATTSNRSRYSGLLSLESIKTMTKKHSLYYGRDLNVTKYKKGPDGVKRRVTLDKLPANDKASAKSGDNTEDEATLVETSELWSNYEAGCTIRLLCPHKYNDAVQSLLSTLETELQCMIGANAYLTPPRSSQGFAPHYDDIEAFCLQLQGSKRWKVYEPTFKLPRTSSEDFTPEDLEGMEPVMDITLEEGDLLYMPRGWIHQACTLKDNNQHSLHLTVSAMQQWAWVDLLEMVMPDAVEAAAMSDSSTSLRQGLPRGFMEYMGVMYEETKDEKLPDSLRRLTEEETEENIHKKEIAILQDRFRAEAKKRIMMIAKTALDMVDATCDQMAKRFISERQPPALTASETALTSIGDDTANAKPILPNTLCRLIRPGVGRLVLEDGKAVVFHCADNSREYLGNPVSPLEFEMDDGPALEQLLTTNEPDWIVVNDLYHDTIEDKIAITQALYDEGILAIKQADENGREEDQKE